MAKYSRSALTMRESLAEISAQRAEQFLNTFYFQYGHRSIADLAHIPFAIERLSLLAAIALVDETRWDGQERSTRYQDFRRSGWFTPALGDETLALYSETVRGLFEAYDALSLGMLDALKGAVAKPETVKQESYERTLKARAFDAARYLLPLATNTSLGQVVNARTLENQVSRLLSSQFGEIRELGGYDEPVCPGQPSLAEAGLETQYRVAMDNALAAYREVRDSGEPEAAQSAQYLLPLGTLCRAMFKMDFSEALYIAELRSGIAGHFSYRRVAWEMYRAIAARHPALADLFRIQDVNEPVDLLTR